MGLNSAFKELMALLYRRCPVTLTYIFFMFFFNSSVFVSINVTTCLAYLRHLPIHNVLPAFFKSFVDRASRYNRVKNQIDAQLILSIFNKPVHVSGVSRPVIRRYKRMDTTMVLIILFR